MPGSKYSLLYVDDEPELLNIARIFLEQTGDFIVTTVPSAGEALTLLQENDFDAIISDYQMPGMDGIGFLKTVRGSFGEIPFILFTGRGREEVVIGAINNGADFYLQKGGDPVAQFAELAHKIRQAIRRSHAERSLVESEKRMSDIINFLPDATFAIDRSGHVIAWNRAIEEMTGIASRDMLGRGNYEYAIPFYGKRRPILVDLIFEPLEDVSSYYSNVLKEGNVLSAETDLPHPKGNRIMVFAKASPLYNRKGETIGAIESIRDISGWQHAADALRESEEKYRLVVENSLDIIFIHQDDRLLFVNSSASDLTGFSMDELQGMEVWDIVHPGDRGRLREAAKKRLSGEQLPTYFTARILTRSGNVLEGDFFVGRVIYLGRPAILGIFHDSTEKKKADIAIRESEEKCRRSEQFLREVIDEAKEGIIVYDTDRVISLWNPAMEEMTGLPAAKIVGNRKPGLFPAINESGIGTLLEQALSGLSGESPDFRFHIPSTGKMGWAKAIYSPHYNTTGEIIGVIGIVRDVTRRKEAELALRASEEQYRNVVEDQTEFISRFTPDGTHVFVNEAYCRHFGLSREDILGHRFRPAIPPGDRERVRGFFESLTPNDPVDTIDHRIILPDGRIRWQRWSDRAIFSEEGRVIEYQSVGRDITDLVKAQEALSETKERLQLALEATSDAVWDTNIPTGMGIFSPRYYTMLGYKAGEFPATHEAWKDLVHPEDIVRAEDAIHETFEHRDTSFMVEFRMRAKTGDWRWILSRGKVVERDAGNQPVRMVGTHTDITPQVLAREALKREHEDLEAAYKEIAAAGEEIRRNNQDLALSKKALQKSEQRYRTIFENTGTATVIIDEDTLIRLANTEFERLSGYTRKEIEGKKKWMEFVIPEDLSRMLAQHRMRRADHDRALRTYEFGFVPRDGGVRHIHLTIDTIPGTRQSVASLTDITSRRETELALIRSEQLYRDILANIQDMYYRSDREGNLILASPSAAKLLGYDSLDEISGRNIAKTLWHNPEERQAFLDLVYRNGAVANQVITLKKRDGTPVIMETNTHLYYDGDGNIAGVEGLIRDISERTRTEEALRESRERFQRIFDDSPLGIAIVSPDFRFRMVNRRFCEMLQYDSDELLAKTSAEITHPDHTGRDIAETTKLYSGELDSYRTEKKYVKKDGSTLWASLLASPVKADDGRVLYAIAMVEDITARKQAEEELSEREAFLCTLVETMTDAILIVDWEGNALFGNPALARLAGFSSFEELSGTNIAKYLSGESRELAFQGLSEVRAGHEGVRRILRLITRDGNERWIEAVGIAVRYRGQDADLVCIRDITEKHHLECQLEEMNRKLTLLSTVTRHDVLNKLTVLFGHLTILKERLTDPGARVSVEKANAAAEAIRKHVEFTRRYEKIGRESPQWQDVAKIVRDAAPPSVTLHLDVDALEVYADPMLQQVFANLFDNSLRHGTHVTEIDVSCRRSGNTCTITFSDNGTGIPAEEKEKIFEKGYGRNTGMGLFLVREILFITGMKVTETGEPGKGARFEITVPDGGYRHR